MAALRASGPSTASALRLFAGLLVLACVMAASARAPKADVHSYALVQEDASLLLRGKLYRLHGVLVPEDGQFCDRFTRPVRCGSRAAVALDRKIRGFVRCSEQFAFDDGSISAVCRVNSGRFDRGEDLGAFLIREGLALAGPDAPFQYRALERIAEANGRGFWGFQADSIRIR
jgi:endonuclease YncB( thermonuclease family)